MATEIDNRWNIERIEELLRRISPSPWRGEALDGLRGTEGYKDMDHAIIAANRIVLGIVYEAGPKGTKRIREDDFEANATFIAAAPEIITWLLSERSAARDEAISDAILALGAIRNQLSTDDALLVYTAIDKLREQK